MSWNCNWSGYSGIPISGIAYSAWLDLGSPNSPSSGYINSWMSDNTNIGRLNNLIITNFYNNTGTVTPGLSPQAADIFKGIYLVSYYTSQINAVLNNGLSSLWTKIADGDGSVTRINPNEIAKTYINLKKTIQAELDTLVFDYCRNAASPRVINMGGAFEYSYASWSYGGEGGGWGDPRFGFGGSDYLQ